MPMRQMSGLRYGENPHQPAAFYSDLSLAEAGRGGIAASVQHHGKEVCIPFLVARLKPCHMRSCHLHLTAGVRCRSHSACQG